MLLNKRAILNLAVEDEGIEKNAPKYLEMIDKDKKEIEETKVFLHKLHEDKKLFESITGLKNIKFEKSHLQAQKFLIEALANLKSIHLQIKKNEKTDAKEFPNFFDSTMKIYQNTDFSYSEIKRIISEDSENKTEGDLANQKLEDLLGKIRGFHQLVHKSLRELILERGANFMEQTNLPIKG
jgi:hypothetical protein